MNLLLWYPKTQINRWVSMVKKSANTVYCGDEMSRDQLGIG